MSTEFRVIIEFQVATEGQGERKNLDNKMRLKKFAMCISYCGKGYLGLQINHGFKTIEGDLMEACYKAGVITEDHMLRPQGMSFQRAARTDKGLTALDVINLRHSAIDPIHDFAIIGGLTSEY